MSPEDKIHIAKAHESIKQALNSLIEASTEFEAVVPPKEKIDPDGVHPELSYMHNYAIGCVTDISRTFDAYLPMFDKDEEPESTQLDLLCEAAP